MKLNGFLISYHQLRSNIDSSHLDKLKVYNQNSHISFSKVVDKTEIVDFSQYFPIITSEKSSLLDNSPFCINPKNLKT
jgi:hypothetical protein